MLALISRELRPLSLAFFIRFFNTNSVKNREILEDLFKYLYHELGSERFYVKQVALQAVASVFSNAHPEPTLVALQTQQAFITDLMAGLIARLSDNDDYVRRAAADSISSIGMEHELPLHKEITEVDRPIFFAFKAHIKKRSLENKNEEFQDDQEKAFLEKVSPPQKKKNLF